MKQLNEIQFTPELIAQVEACSTPEELVKLAKEHEVDLSLEEAQTYFAKCVKMELTDEQLDEVGGEDLLDSSLITAGKSEKIKPASKSLLEGIKSPWSTMPTWSKG